MSLHPFQTAILEQRDDAYADVLAPTVQLHSPVLHLPFVGRETVASLLPELRGTFSEVVYTDTLEAPATLGLVFRGTIAGLDAEGLQLLRFDGGDLIEDITVMLRPMSAGRALAEAMGPKIERLPNNTYGVLAAPTQTAWVLPNGHRHRRERAAATAAGQISGSGLGAGAG